MTNQDSLVPFFSFQRDTEPQEKVLGKTGPASDKLGIIISHFTDEATEAPRS